MKTTLVAAIGRGNRTIGKDGCIPWDIPEETQHFRNYIEGKTIVMGRKTFENTGVFDDCINIVVSRTLPDDVNPEVARNIEEALDIAEYCGTTELCVIGGETLYRQFIDDADEMVISLVDGNYDGDRHFPPIILDEWDVKSQNIRNQFTVMNYER